MPNQQSDTNTITPRATAADTAANDTAQHESVQVREELLRIAKMLLIPSPTREVYIAELPEKTQSIARAIILQTDSNTQSCLRQIETAVIERVQADMAVIERYKLELSPMMYHALRQAILSASVYSEPPREN